MKRLGWLVLGLVVVGSGACGGAAAPAAPSEAAPSGGGEYHHEVAAPSAGTAGQAPVAPEIAGARGEMDRAERQLSSSLGDCAAACRALASMERAADHLCALESGPECSHARERVEAARERVRSTCGGCSR